MSLDVRAPALATGPVPALPPAARPPSLRGRALAVVAPAALTVVLGLWGIRRQNTLWGDEAVTY
ncbi:MULTISPECIES: hypothetical protein [Streptomyces]|uniref:ABC transporter permease n=1 Tax=Streptomyces bacillaris TaxID=68179 RepID=A0ABW6E8A1_9ACTN